jgi:hypothetical protein
MRVRSENYARALSAVTHGGKDESHLGTSESAKAYFTFGGDKFMCAWGIAEALKISGPIIFTEGNLL